MTPSQQVDEMIAHLGDWRGPTIRAVRAAILAADPAVVEEWKWMGSPTYYCDGLICVADAHKAKIKVTFANGAKVDDPEKVFNGGFEGNARRFIDYLEGDAVDEARLTRLVQAAIAFNRAKAAAKTRPKRA